MNGYNDIECGAGPLDNILTSEKILYTNLDGEELCDNTNVIYPADSSILHLPKSAFRAESSSSDEETDLEEHDVINSRHTNSYIFNDSDIQGDPNKTEYHDLYVTSNSPMASNCNSDLEDQHSVHLDQSFVHSKRRKSPYKKFTYENIENSLSKYYDQNERVFTEMDVIITYLKGIQLVYAHSKTATQTKLYCLVMFTLGLSMSLSVLAPFVKDSVWGFYLLSAGNALITLFIATTRYLKLEHSAVGFSLMAKQYSKIESTFELESSIIRQKNANSLNSSNPRNLEDSLAYPPTDYTTSRQSDALQQLELKLTEIREICNVLVPEEVIRLLPLIYNTNIFRFIKKMEQYKTNLIVRFRDIKNEIHYILYKWNSSEDDVRNGATPSPRHIREKNRLLYLMDLKEKTKQDLILCKNTYAQMDELFNKEIRYAETHQSCFACASWVRPGYDFSKLNPVVRDYLKLVIPD